VPIGTDAEVVIADEMCFVVAMQGVILFAIARLRLQLSEFHTGGYIKETGKCNATATSEKSHRFQAGSWFPD
jgi:hypothetical protein